LPATTARDYRRTVHCAGRERRPAGGRNRLGGLSDVPNGSACALPTVGLTCASWSTCNNATAGQTVGYLAAQINTPCGQNLTSGSIVPVKVQNPDGQFYVYYSLQVYANSDGHLSGWTTTQGSPAVSIPALQTGRAFMGGVVGFDDLRSAYVYIVGGITCSGDCPKTPTAGMPAA